MNRCLVESGFGRGTPGAFSKEKFLNHSNMGYNGCAANLQEEGKCILDKWACEHVVNAEDGTLTAG